MPPCRRWWSLADELHRRRGPPLQPPHHHPRGGDGRQKRLKNAKVLCVGAGGPRQPGSALPGRGRRRHAGIVEFDTVDESNLQRQIIHGQSDIGRSKAESARESVLEVNPQ